MSKCAIKISDNQGFILRSDSPTTTALCYLMTARVRNIHIIMLFISPIILIQDSFPLCVPNLKASTTTTPSRKKIVKIFGKKL